MKTAIINHKKYSVEYVYNMVGNWHFTDKDNVIYLVDGEDVQAWADDEGMKWNGVNTAIAYAREISQLTEDGHFWWTVKE